jgi:hypothetical protein
VNINIIPSISRIELDSLALVDDFPSLRQIVAGHFEVLERRFCDRCAGVNHDRGLALPSCARSCPVVTILAIVRSNGIDRGNKGS